MKYAFVNGEMTESARASISIEDRGLRFGDGVFETIRLHRGVPYLWDYHIERLNEGLRTLYIPEPVWPLKKACLSLLAHNDTEEGTLRIAITRGIGSRGYLPTGNQSSLIIELLPSAEAQSHPRLWLSSHRRMSPSALPTHLKLSQGLNSTLALLEAERQGYDNALLLSQEGHISECANANIFWLKNGKIHTPALTTGCIAGVTRRRLMELTPIIETEATFAELLQAESIAISNARLGLQQVAHIASAESELALNGLLGTLSELLTADCARYTDTHHEAWLA